MYKTKQKDMLISFLEHNRDKQFSINEIAEKICSDNIGKSTIYRLVKILVNDGLIRCFYDENTKLSLYQFADKSKSCNDHFHLKCNICNKIIHLECTHTEELKEHFAFAHKFNIDVSKTILYGYCDDCRKEASDL